MDKREYAIRQKLKADFFHYAEKCLNVRAKEGRIIPFLLNAAQKYIHERIEKQLAETGRVRALILKGRQQGCSTYVEGRYYWKVTHARGVRAFILTHLDDATRNIYEIVRRFHDNCPSLVRPSTSLANARALQFDKLDSGYQVGTARSDGVGRSNTLQYFHGSEVAYWPNAEDHMAGILQAVPDIHGTEIILESTSAGASGMFYKLCREAERGKGEYQFIFVPWFWQPEYRKTPPYDLMLTVEEEEFKETYKLDNAQVYWRRIKISELGSVWTFRREYPATMEEAFAADMPGALWRRETIHKNRKTKDDVPALKRVVVAVDPAVSSHNRSDETGIIVAGLGADGHGYILEDLSGKYTPAEWAAKVVSAYYRHSADRIVAEVNQGGDMVEHTLRTYDPTVSFKSVHASRGKITRAEPVAALDEQGRIHHAGIFAALEDEMCRFDPSGDLAGGKSPDRVDARVWAITELMLCRHYPQGPRVWGG